jgi:predicted membrane channel-forming protein YqfA (hemolysin III family)
MFDLYQTTFYILLGFTVFTLICIITKKRIYTLDSLYRPLLTISVLGFIASIFNTNYSYFNENISNNIGFLIFVTGLTTAMVASAKQIRGK